MPLSSSSHYRLEWITVVKKPPSQTSKRTSHSPALFSFNQERSKCKVLDDLSSVSSQWLATVSVTNFGLSFLLFSRACLMLFKQTWLKLFDMFCISMFQNLVWCLTHGRHPVKVCWLHEWMNESVTIQMWGRLTGTCSSALWDSPLSGLKKVPYSGPDVISQESGGNFGTDIFCLREAHCVKTYSYGNNKLWWWWFF